MTLVVEASLSPNEPARAAHKVARLGSLALRRVPGPGLAAIYLSLLVLIPLATLLSNAFSGGLSATWSAITDPESLAAIRLALLCSAIVVVVNTLLGTLIAWQLVRDKFVLN